MYISFCKTTNILSILLIEMRSFVGGGGGGFNHINRNGGGGGGWGEGVFNHSDRNGFLCTLGFHHINVLC